MLQSSSQRTPERKDSITKVIFRTPLSGTLQASDDSYAERYSEDHVKLLWWNVMQKFLTVKRRTLLSKKVPLSILDMVLKVPLIWLPKLQYFSKTFHIEIVTWDSK